MDPSFFPARLKIARAFNGLSQAELAHKLEVSPAAICQIETGNRPPSEPMRFALAEQLGVLPEFFKRPLADEFHDDECHFRRRRTTPQYIRARALAHGTMFGMAVRYLDEMITLPPVSFPSGIPQDRAAIERIAEHCRVTWGLGLDAPIVSMMRVVERAGAVVCRYPAGAEKVDAFSRAGFRPIIVLNADKQSASRSRWDLAHEAGHLVMHVGRPTGDAETEAQADQFAGALLLPRAGMVREFPRMHRLDWDALFRLKRRWRTSVAALVRRAFDLGLLDAVLYQRAYKYIHFKGWHKGEPDEPEIEQPELFGLGVQAISNTIGHQPADIARHLGWLRPTFERVTGISSEEAERKPLGNVVPLRRNSSA